ncbi:hypothetical protein L2E82_28101 [Cichorium intybus]|uniref:Uncharacterized protein n=1 Tax=Cichorium intybus TaxID=13427 RepID=A0ACB9CUP1_CICIN|nr:hypothetical protein L2E82_28101 [Cichorium intybus]
MAIIGDALRQAFMPNHEYQSLRDEDKAWIKLRRPIFIFIFSFLMFSIVISSVISFKMVFPNDLEHRPFCKNLRIEKAKTNISTIDDDREGRDFYLSDQEIVHYYSMIAFVPPAILFLLSAVYLIAGMTVAYTAPTRHACLKVVENNYCAPVRGGVRCLFFFNSMFAIIFGVLAIFLGLILLTSGSSCSIPLFWCYEVQMWGLVSLYGVTASLLRRKAATILDDGDIDGNNQIIGVEMLEFNDNEMVLTPDVERRINQGFRSWMGTSYLSSDDEDDPDENT